MDPVRIFLCDDVAELRAVIRLGLERDAGLQVVGEAQDAQTGVDGIAELRPDVVFLDLSMPGMDGLEAIPLIRAVSPHTAIIVFSGFAATRMAAEAVAQGADGYLEKGVPMRRLHETAYAAAAAYRAA